MYKICNLQWKHTHSSIHIHVVHVHKTSNIHHVQDNLQENTIAELNTRILILRISFLANIYVAATFHPTIGQCAHQSLSNTVTPELGMIPLG